MMGQWPKPSTCIWGPHRFTAKVFPNKAIVPGSRKTCISRYFFKFQIWVIPFVIITLLFLLTSLNKCCSWEEAVSFAKDCPEKAPLQWALRDRADRFPLSHIWEDKRGSNQGTARRSSLILFIDSEEDMAESYGILWNAGRFGRLNVEFPVELHSFAAPGCYLDGIWGGPLHVRLRPQAPTSPTGTFGWVSPDFARHRYSIWHARDRQGQNDPWLHLASPSGVAHMYKTNWTSLQRSSDSTSRYFWILVWPVFHPSCCKCPDKPEPFRLGREHNWRRSWTLPGTAGCKCHRNLQKLLVLMNHHGW